MKTTPGQRRRLPFTQLDRAAWMRLGIVSLAVIYALSVLWNALAIGASFYFLTDLRSFIASAQIVRDHGFAAVYDLSLQADYQRALLASAAGSRADNLVVAPTAYLPPFVVLFLPLLLFSPVAAWWAWALANLALLLFYLRRLMRAAGSGSSGWLLIGLALSLPAFLNLYLGQVEVWLLVFLGEAMLAVRRRQDFTAGLWLAGLLIKPQTLVLLVPGLLIGRRVRTCAGFAMAAAGIGLLSLWLMGPAGFQSWLGLLVGYSGYPVASGAPSSAPDAMMNWRALAINLDNAMPSPLWLPLALAGTLVTGIIAVALWYIRPVPGSAVDARIWLATWAATCVVAWHSHVHMALPLLAAAILVWGDAYWRSRTFMLWLIAPAALYWGFVYAYVPLMTLLGYEAWVGTPPVNILGGVSLFAVNLVLLGEVCYLSLRTKSASGDISPQNAPASS